MVDVRWNMCEGRKATVISNEPEFSSCEREISEKSKRKEISHPRNEIAIKGIRYDK
jgi:hypothetical protein